MSRNHHLDEPLSHNLPFPRRNEASGWWKSWARLSSPRKCLSCCWCPCWWCPWWRRWGGRRSPGPGRARGCEEPAPPPLAGVTTGQQCWEQSLRRKIFWGKRCLTKNGDYYWSSYRPLLWSREEEGWWRVSGSHLQRMYHSEWQLFVRSNT